MGRILELIPASLHEDLIEEVLDELLKTNSTAAKVHGDKIKTLVEKHAKADEKLSTTINKIVDEYIM